MKTYFFLAVCLILALNCKQRSDNSDVTGVEITLEEFSRALATGDSAEIQRLAGPTFVLLEEGREYDLSAMISSIRHALSSGGKLTRRITEFHTEVRGTVAWSHYRINGEFESGHVKMSLSLLEASVLERVGDQWRVVQMTTIPAASR
jgi:hypothetical protein